LSSGPRGNRGEDSYNDGIPASGFGTPIVCPVHPVYPVMAQAAGKGLKTDSGVKGFRGSITKDRFRGQRKNGEEKPHDEISRPEIYVSWVDK